MADQPINNMSETWNAGGTTFSAIKHSITDTASAAASLIVNLLVGGVAKFTVSKGGLVTAAAGYAVSANDGGPLGASAVGFSDAFFASGAVFGFATSAYTITHSAGLLTFSHNIAATSDARLKDHVVDIDGALEKVRQMRGTYFTRKDEDTGRRYMGVIAQEIERVAPELVDNSGEYKSVMYGNAVGLLVEAIKEMANLVEAQEIRIRMLEGR